MTAAEAVKKFEPESGWWKTETAPFLEECVQELFNLGMPMEAAGEFVEGICSLIHNEYGN